MMGTDTQNKTSIDTQKSRDGERGVWQCGEEKKVHKDRALERKKAQGYYVKDGHKEKMCKAMTDGDHVRDLVKRILDKMWRREEKSAQRTCHLKGRKCHSCEG
jgi:hypothetical protein